MNKIHLLDLLPFFIEAATPIQPCPYWKYFMVYSQKGQLVSLYKVFEDHQNAKNSDLKSVRCWFCRHTKDAGSHLRCTKSFTSKYYVQQQPKCFEIVVEDAADDFQKVQDISN
jgi:hypothetical protein